MLKVFYSKPTVHFQGEQRSTQRNTEKGSQSSCHSHKAIFRVRLSSKKGKTIKRMCVSVCQKVTYVCLRTTLRAVCRNNVRLTQPPRAPQIATSGASGPREPPAKILKREAQTIGMTWSMGICMNKQYRYTRMSDKETISSVYPSYHHGVHTYARS